MTLGKDFYSRDRPLRRYNRLTFLPGSTAAWKIFKRFEDPFRREHPEQLAQDAKRQAYPLALRVIVSTFPQLGSKSARCKEHE
ncbi:hypothetical protein E1B28_011730 [Marasmius oreades]|uniref:Uncharacterized protein n=1 Tax=Marasmius oreades TaxID=181124 RepID=A0A9P7RUR2_9AGAR|nr:uncharacterized protein E1B28_011730 [Marasmius oreades]KAG7090119.1 hypothetical protein E1B28_011730 [Marasmius oreades]